MRGLLALFILSLVCTAWAGVQVLTDENFDAFIAENELALVEFYAPWCGHCKRLDPEYTQAGVELEGVEGTALGKVDATVEKQLGGRFKIEGYPTLKLFRSGVPSSYEGGRTASDIVSYMKKQGGPAVKLLSTEEQLAEFIPDDASDAPVVVAFAKEDSDLAKFITSYASKFRDDYSFGLVSSPNLAGDNEMDSIVLFKPFDELKNSIKGVNDETQLTDFLKANSIQAVGEISPANYATYLKRGAPISWLFIDPADNAGTERVLAEYRLVAPSIKALLSPVYLNGQQYKQMATKMGLTGDKFPGLAIERQNEHFVFPEEEELTAATMQPWFDKYLTGDLLPTIKSEPIPESLFDENNVATIVANNFKEVVLDPTKDVLLEFYAPWCGHCKSLVPTWNQLGKTFKGVPSIVIAKTDATVNDYPGGFQVTGFPTIQLVTSKTNTAIKYSGDREGDAIIAWLKANAQTPFELDAQAESASDDQDEL